MNQETIKQMAIDAQKAGDDNLAIALFTLAGAMAANEMPWFASKCQEFARELKRKEAAKGN